MTITVKALGPHARADVPTHASDCGNLSIGHNGEYTVAALAQNEVVAISKIPKGSDVYGCHYSHAAMGSTTALQIGWTYVDDSDGDVDAFATVADASTAGSGWASCAPFTTQKEAYVIVKQTGAGTGAGKLTAQAIYNFTNSVD